MLITQRHFYIMNVSYSEIVSIYAFKHLYSSSQMYLGEVAANKLPQSAQAYMRKYNGTKLTATDSKRDNKKIE